MLTHTLSHLQLVAGKDRRIYQAINLARDAIWAAGKRGHGCGILDTDLVAGFDYMTLSWCLKVMEKKGACPEFLARLRNLYTNNLSVIVVNNIQSAAVQNVRVTLRQGDVPRMVLFCFGIDPLIHRLERVLQGILISAAPVHGPVLQGMPALPKLEQRYKLIGYADDNKPAITSKAEFKVVDSSLALFERASGCKLHRDPLNKKCKFLPLGSWRTTLKQEDIPCEYMTLSDHLDMIGVTLMATWTKTRKTNGDALQSKIKNTIQPWKAGKFLPITQRGWSLNCHALSKVWFRARCIDLIVCDTNAIMSSYKSWIYQDMFEKPAELILHRPHHHGGLGLHSPKFKALAGFITTFLQTAVNPSYISSLLHNQLYRKYVLEEDDVAGAPTQPPPYFTQELFDLIKKVKRETTINIISMTERDWTRVLTEDHITMKLNPVTNSKEFIPCKSELASPGTDWQISWTLSRQQGIHPELTSFLWKMLHNLLGTQERLHRLGSSPSPTCIPCKQVNGTLRHELLECTKNNGIGEALLSCLQTYMPNLTPSSLLRLEFPNMNENMQLSSTIITAVTLSVIWKERQANSKVRTYQVRSEIEQTINLLRTTRLSNISVALETQYNQMFQ